MKKFLITGGCGFIGSHIVHLLVDEGYEVSIFDNFSTGKRENVAAVADNIKIIEGDIRNAEEITSAAMGVDCIIHHAAEISVEKSVHAPAEVNETNVIGTLNVLMAARNGGVKRVILASSSAIYGDTGNKIQVETMLPSPLSPYGASKIANEYYMSCFYKLYGLETVCLRYFNVYGERQNPNSTYAAVIPKFITNIINDRPLTINGDGMQCRDFVYAGDVAKANLLAALSPDACGEVFNIACENSVTINELATILCEISGKNVPIIHGKPLAGDIKYSGANTQKARKILGFEPQIKFDEGLRRTYSFFVLLGNM